MSDRQSDHDAHAMHAPLDTSRSHPGLAAGIDSCMRIAAQVGTWAWPTDIPWCPPL